MTTPATGLHVCPSYFSIFLDNWIRRLLQPPARILVGYLQPGDTALDIGCGPGFFTLAMARMVGPGGRVYAIDLQAPMLARVERKASRKGMADRVHLHQCRPDRLDLSVQTDFALAYYMIHETPSVQAFLEEVHTMVRPGGHLLTVEPRIHVRRGEFEKMCRMAEAQGWQTADLPTGKGGYSALFRRL